MTQARARDGRGSAAVLGTVLLAALAVVSVLVTVLGGAVADQRRVESAADLGALAGAQALQDGRAGCAAAAAVIRRNRARLARCAVDSEIVTVTATLRTQRVLGRTFVVSGQARAGPTGSGQLAGGGSS